MHHKSSVSYDNRAGCWSTQALGELRETRAGRPYRSKTLWRDLTHTVRDELAAQARLHA